MESLKKMKGLDEHIWEDPVVKRWLDTIVKASTKANYKSAFKTYLEYTKITPTQMIDEAVEDSKKDLRQRRDILLTRILGFYAWLKTDYEKKSRGTGPHHVIGKGVSDKLATCYSGAIRSFYVTYDLAIKLRGRRRIPKARVTNKRMIVGGEQVKVLHDHARSPRDRAIILTNFQGGLEASTLCTINYGDVAEGLAKNEYPLKLELQRVKTGIDFYTFVGRDAIEALKAYLSDMKQRGVTFTHSTPLFLQDKSKARMKPENIEEMMKFVAQRAGFVDSNNNGKEFNPLGAHALRESMGSIMTNSGVPDTIVDFWHGHEIGEMAEAYKSVQFPSLKQMYLDREKLLSISAQKVDVEEIKEKLRVEVEQQNKQLQLMVNNLLSENMDLKNRVQGLEKSREGAERKLSDFEKTLSELRRAFQELEKS